MKASSLDLADKQELNFLAELIGELRDIDPERARQLLAAFLAGFNEEHR
jgi:hypothetical protein